MTITEAPPLSRELLRASLSILGQVSPTCQVDLSWTAGNLGNGDAIFSGPLIEALRYNIEEKSDHRLTVRRVDSIMAPVAVQGRCAWLMLCPIDTPEEMLIRPIEGGTLILLTPSKDGLQHGLSPLPINQIKRREAERATQRVIRERQDAERAERDARIEDARLTIKVGLQFYQERHELDTEGGHSGVSPTQLERLGSLRLDDVLAICDELGVDLEMVLGRGLALRRSGSA